MCIDYYGECRPVESQWVDDDTWIYACSDTGITVVGLF